MLKKKKGKTGIINSASFITVKGSLECKFENITTMKRSKKAATSCKNISHYSHAHN